MIVIEYAHELAAQVFDVTCACADGWFVHGTGR
jgi:hypothetical protein